MGVIINLTAVLAAAVASFAVGGLWYGPLFGKQWLHLSGRTHLEVKKSSSAKAMAFNFLATFVMAYVLAHFVYFIGAVTVSDGLQLGFWVWLGFVATIGLNSVFFDGRPWKLFWLNNLYQLVSLIIMAVILSIWK